MVFFLLRFSFPPFFSFGFLPLIAHLFYSRLCRQIANSPGFHFLTSAFDDILDTSRSEWIETSLVRFAYPGNEDQSHQPHREEHRWAFMDYAVHFPLTYIFSWSACPQDVSFSFSSQFVLRRVFWSVFWFAVLFLASCSSGIGASALLYL
jgi:hypothetical protein